MKIYDILLGNCFKMVCGLRYIIIWMLFNWFFFILLKFLNLIYKIYFNGNK